MTDRTKRFAAELRRAMARRGLRRVDLYRPIGADSTIAKRWLTGQTYPDHRTVIRIAEVLDWPSLVERSIADRSGTCEACGKPTLATRGSVPPRYCGSRCIRRVTDRERNGRKRHQVVGVVTRERDRLREAVAAFCGDCTLGDGVCRDAECLLRPVSPLPFVPLAEVRRRAA